MPSSCPAFVTTAGPLPGVEPEQLTLAFWLERLSQQLDLDEVLLEAKDIAALNAALKVPRADFYAERDLLAPVDLELLGNEVRERLQWVREKLERGEYSSNDGSKFSPAALASLTEPMPLSSAKPELKVALGDAMIHCTPTREGFFGPALDPRLDRNSCSVLRQQDVVRVIADWPNGMKLVEAEYSWGWLGADARLSPPVPERLARNFVSEAPLLVSADLQLSTVDGAITLAAGTRLPQVEGQAGVAYVASSSGFEKTSAEHARLLQPTRRGLTRRTLLQEVWRYLGTPYGLGDTGGGRDCSRLLRDAFGAFNLELPRHSSWQSTAGSFWIDIESVPEAGRPWLFDAAARRGIVLLHFPGHIMLYLGRNQAGQPLVLHGLGEYVEPCAQSAGGTVAETLVRVENITVSNLELGRGTSRKALIERITRITVIGGTAGPELLGVAVGRPPAPAKVPPNKQCKDSERAAIYALPEQPNQQQPLRVVAAINEDPGAATFTLIDPDGQRVQPELVRLGGPPFGQVATIEQPKLGTWKAVFADGDEVLACQRITVAARRPRARPADAGAIWKPRHSWHLGNENLYALFVERLFDYGALDERVWPNLHSLLRDQDRNLLHDYRGLGEDEDLVLVPDCADLPYALRAYFAWKLRLPFGFRRCSRGRIAKPPRCDEPGGQDNLMSRLELRGKGGQLLPRKDVEAFQSFVNVELASAVHSSSGRTLPDDELTDLYPISLTRNAIKPGTVFADPYGHFLVVVDWLPQRFDGYGLLVGADAQPDGTIGRRRFWQGTFLFDPDRSNGGAGFKAFRPRSFVEEPVKIELELDDKAAANAAELTRSSEPLLASTSSLSPARVAPADARGGVVPPTKPRASPVAVKHPQPPGSSKLEKRRVAGHGGDAADPGLAAMFDIERIGYLKDTTNRELAGSRRFNGFSLQQYQGSADDFYARVEALINPRPLQAKAVQQSLVDALHEAVSRRVVSVANGEKWFSEHAGAIVDMPEGERIFLTSGPWEDFSTPSRDLRLLIAIDTVLGFSRRVRLTPAQYGLGDGQVAATVQELDELLPSELAKRTVRYTRSDGNEQLLTLQAVVDRAPAFELAYNPNDCIEVRWGAAAGSAEMASCRRRAPAEQRQRMLDYQGWFATRKRPPQ